MNVGTYNQIQHMKLQRQVPKIFVEFQTNKTFFFKKNNFPEFYSFLEIFKENIVTLFHKRIFFVTPRRECARKQQLGQKKREVEKPEKVLVTLSKRLRTSPPPVVN